MSKRSVVTLGDKVRSARKAKNLSQLELAQKAGVRPEVVSRIETGRSPASLGSLFKIAPIIDVTVDELSKLSENFQPVDKTVKKKKKGT